MNKKLRKFTVVLPLLIIVLLAFFAVTVGTKFISPLSIFSNTLSDIDRTIVTRLRVPRILISILCGALLGGTGAVFQGFFRNPLADSGIMGISSGATFGAVLSGLIPVQVL